MLNVERRNIILEMLGEKLSVSVADLTARLEVSEVTVRKMLNDMARLGQLRRTRGGAVSLSMPVREMSVSGKASENIAQKKAIALRAYDFIEDHETIFLDAGTTTLELVRRIKSGKKRDLTVVTNAINIASELLDTPDINVILIGGELRHGVISCVGVLAEQAIVGLYFDRAFIAANHVSLKFGASTPNLLEAQVKKTARAGAGKSYLLCDSSKFSGSSLSRIGPLDAFDAVITDKQLPQTTRNEFRAAKIKLIIA
jgi:DeoR/GlpR family transcriptional regulator of sugar metabolism